MSQQEAFTLGLQKPQQQLQNMRLDYAADGTAVYKPISTPTPTPTPPPYHPNLNGAEPRTAVPQAQLGTSESMKRKRGRPRKYGPDATIASSFTPASQAPPSAPPGAGAAATTASDAAFASPNSTKKGRGRPRGSVTKHRFRAAGPAGVSLIPHVITVKAGEDLLSKIMSLCMNGPRNVCILTANGSISNVTLRQPAASAGTVTYEGRFEILTLGGSLLHSGHGGETLRFGGLNVSLSGPDGRVVGGGVAGLLVAASPIQVVLASFAEEDRKGSKSAKKIENLSASAKVATTGPTTSPSQGTLSESSGGGGSPHNQNNNPPQVISGMPWK